STGDVELTGTPRVQEGLNMHVATSPDTVMVINQNSQLTTHGPSRTEIRRPPRDEKKKKPPPPPQNSPGSDPACCRLAQTMISQTAPVSAPKLAASVKPKAEKVLT